MTIVTGERTVTLATWPLRYFETSLEAELIVRGPSELLRQRGF